METQYTENTLCKLLCKMKDQVAMGDKNNNVSKIDSSYSETVYFGETKRSLKLQSDKKKDQKLRL